jgi:heptosyltransferase I
VRILILRTSALGDVVHALPVLTALRRRLPEARLGWVAEERVAPLLAGHPDLDAVIPVRLRAWRRRPFAAGGEVTNLLDSLRAFSADVALDLMGNFKAGFLAALSGAPRRIGAARPFRREPASAFLINEPVAAPAAHAVDRNLEIAAPLVGAAAGPADFGGGKLFAGAALPEGLAATLPERFALLHPGAGWGNKIYPPARWGEVARRLAAIEGGGLPLLVATAPGEEGLAAAVAAASGGAAVAVDAPDLPTLAALTRRAHLFLGGDSGPTHLAHALGTPVLMLMGPTAPETNGPYAAPESALFHRLPCSFCHARFTETKACLLEISPEQVARRAALLLR